MGRRDKTDPGRSGRVSEAQPQLRQPRAGIGKTGRVDIP